MFFFAGCPGLRLGWSSFTFVQLMFFGRHGDGVLTSGEKLTWSWLCWRSQADDLHVERPDSHLDHLGLAGVLLVTCGRWHKIPSFNSFVEHMKFIIFHHHVLWGTSNIIVVHGSSGKWIDGISGGSKMAAPPWESYVDGMPMAYHITPDRDIGYVCQAWLKLVWITLSFYSNWDHSTTFHLTPRGSGSVFPVLPKTSFCPLESDPICRSWVSHLLYVLLARQRGSHVQ